MPFSLQKITLYSFKSFQDEVVIDRIESFTIIIGPNGSGKSNIVDAINFALGAKSSALRVKHLNELIHGTVIGMPRTKIAYVTLLFIGDHNKEKSFKREIGERGSSRYAIDGKIVDYNYYMSELNVLNLNIKANNFLMPQGYIHNFANILPRELTALLEKFSGSNIYKANYERLQLELSKVTEEIQFLYQKKKDLLSQKKSAVAEQKEEEKYLQLQKQYMKEKSKSQIIKLIYITKIIASLKNEKERVKLEMDEYLQNKETAVSSLKEIELKVNSLSDSWKELEEDILQLEKNFQEKTFQNIILKDNILYFQEKRTSAYTSLESVNNMNNAREKTIQELRDELESLNKKLTEFEITLESIALDHEQVNRYMILTTKVECLLKESLDHINNKMHDRQTDQYKLDNKNRRREEIVIEQKREKLEKENLQIQFGKLQTLNDLFKSRLEEKIAEKQILQKRISDREAKNTNIIEISNKLALIEIDNDIILQLEKKVAVIRNLKEVFPGVYDRLSNLCKPIHSRYNVAVTKAFGIYMDSIVVDTQDTAKECIYFLKQYEIGVETFLPLDTIKSKPPNEKLRTELEDTNIKLLFDVLKISSTQINKAVLHVIKDILVCETATEASKKAFENDVRYDCVSLDGCFFRKSGLISGGLTNLAKKAKQWENIQSLSAISVLKEQKKQLEQELKDLPNISRMQFDLDTINKDINQLIARNEVIEEDIKETKEKISTQDIKLNDLDEKLSSQDIIISGIRNNIQEKDKEIKIIESDNNKIKSEIFDDFCKENNLPDITYYEDNLCLYKDQENKKLELLNLKANIENQLKFEEEFNRDSEFKDKVLKYTCALEQAEKEYNKACEQERDMKIALDQEEIKISHLKTEHTRLKKALQEAKDQCIQYKAQINIITKTYLEKKKIYLKIEQSMANKKNDCLTIIKECKVENINIPILSDSQDDSSTPSSYLSTESTLHEKQINIDFSKIPKDFQNYNQIDLEHLEKCIQNCERNVTELQRKLQTLKKPNLKAHEKVDLIVQQLKDIAETNKNLSTAFKNIETQFKLIKGKRHEQFSGCLECINAEIDSIYKNLVNDPSAQALVITENPEEPYMGGIIYSCLPPSKRFTQIQYLSDGERSLATLALLFAMLRYKSPPFFIMDEGDAALDRVNVEKLIRFIGTEKNRVPFIMVTLNDNISSSADVDIGVTTDPNTKYLQSRIYAVPLE